jgi:GNAT superfamily N-acetyltransferase
MRSALLEAIGPVTIRYFQGEDGEWELGEQADQIARASGIRIGSNKDLTLLALSGDNVLGAVWSAFERDHDASENHNADIYRYDFDVAVRPDARGTGLTTARVGPRLIDAALRDYRDRRHDVDGAYIRVWVVNPKLAQWLQDRYGFETEGRGWSQDTPHLVYYGS